MSSILCQCLSKSLESPWGVPFWPPMHRVTEAGIDTRARPERHEGTEIPSPRGSPWRQGPGEEGNRGRMEAWPYQAIPRMPTIVRNRGRNVKRMSIRFVEGSMSARWLGAVRRTSRPASPGAPAAGPAAHQVKMCPGGAPLHPRETWQGAASGRGTGTEVPLAMEGV